MAVQAPFSELSAASKSEAVVCKHDSNVYLHFTAAGARGPRWSNATNVIATSRSSAQMEKIENLMWEVCTQYHYSNILHSFTLALGKYIHQKSEELFLRKCHQAAC
jgi:hypothetical protein